MGKLPKIDLTADFILPIKFYWAREHQCRPQTERAFTGGLFTAIKGANGLHPLFADFDWTTLKKVEQETREMQKNWKLGSAYIYKSGKESFHVKFYYDWLPFRKVIKILESQNGVDKGYVRIAKDIGGCVLRTCKKPRRGHPKFTKIVKSQFQAKKTQNELDWGDIVRLAVESLIGMPLIWLKDFRNGELTGRFK